MSLRAQALRGADLEGWRQWTCTRLPPVTGVTSAAAVVVALACIAVYAALVDPMAWLAVVLLGVVALPAVALLLLLASLARSAAVPRRLAGTAAGGLRPPRASVVAGLALWNLAVSIDGHDSGEVALSAVIAALALRPASGTCARDVLRSRRC